MTNTYTAIPHKTADGRTDYFVKGEASFGGDEWDFQKDEFRHYYFLPELEGYRREEFVTTPFDGYSIRYSFWDRQLPTEANPN